MLKKLQDKGILRIQDSAFAPLTQNNIALPGGLLNQMSTKLIEVILRKRNADKVIGQRNKLANWEMEQVTIPMLEKIGQTTPYSDWGLTRSTALNLNFFTVRNYRFSARIEVGALETKQLAQVKVDAYAKKFEAASEALAVEFNNVAFNGYIDNTSGSFLCYGLFNNPDMPAYQAITKKWEASTWKEVVATITAGVTDLITKSGSNINEDSKIKLVLPPQKIAWLKNLYTDLGISVYKLIVDGNYGNIEIVSAIELAGAYTGNVDVMYFIAEDPIGGTADTLEQGYSELNLMSNVVLSENRMSQEISSGSLGTILYKPTFISRWQGL